MIFRVSGKRSTINEDVYWDMKSDDGRGEWWLSFDAYTRTWKAWNGVGLYPEHIEAMREALSEEDRAFALAKTIEWSRPNG